MPARGGRWDGFWEQRARQLQRQLQAKEERLVEAETENAVLHLRLAQYREMIKKSGGETTQVHVQCGDQKPLQRPGPLAASRLRLVAQRLKRDVEVLHSWSLGLFRRYQDAQRDCLSEIVTAVQRAPLCHEALPPAGPLEAGCLERSLQEMTERYQQERRERRRLHNTLVTLEMRRVWSSFSLRKSLPGDIYGQSISIRAEGSPQQWSTRQWRRGTRGVASLPARSPVHQAHGPCMGDNGELRGSIRVHCRLRPVLPFDDEFRGPGSQNSPVSGAVAHALDDETILVECSRPGRPLINKTYTFERVYGPAESQRAVFEDVCPLLTSFLDGYDVCIMAYGQTGSGKSFTMLGPRPEQDPALPSGPHGHLGIIPRAAGEVFRSVQSAVELMTLVAAALRLRTKQATAVHADSSRSHLVITVTLTAAASSCSTADRQSDQSPPAELRGPTPRRPAPGRRPGAARTVSSVSPRTRGLGQGSQGPGGQVLSKLQLVDLAGSECVGVSGVTGSALRETSLINRSLAALADVLGALSEGRGHIPYRNSTLTHFLQDALGGDAKLQVIVCVSPCQKHVAETLQSLGFGARVRQVERGRPAPRKPRR
ncbi:kinesin-like protein KIF25 isoform X6 [Vicugna pacos]|uniref:Kinesin-like protein n=1 Tax=Vicugna pacos TaxID=30538 RepID=A0ABM5DN71_VICPA